MIEEKEKTFTEGAEEGSVEKKTPTFNPFGK